MRASLTSASGSHAHVWPHCWSGMREMLTGRPGLQTQTWNWGWRDRGGGRVTASYRQTYSSLISLAIFTLTLKKDSFFFSFIFISWRLITSQHCSGFCHPLTWLSHGVTCIPHPDPPSHLPLHLIPLGLSSAPGPSTCLMHPTWAGDLFHYR